MQVRLPPAGVRLRDILNRPTPQNAPTAPSRPAASSAARVLNAGSDAQNRLYAVSQQIVRQLEQLENTIQQSESARNPIASSASPSSRRF
ncbi:hypothetical protein [Thiolinea disciformis]|uniref:hypothetical protein n=1 Tax=Thiolinea disciformis TaxID=125614 RepID=UPI000372F487|nr:hypothetical protein [Thiolinea disciformis]